jgi:hypothetical protein
MEKLEDPFRAQADSSGPLNDVGPYGINGSGYASQLGADARVNRRGSCCLFPPIRCPPRRLQDYQPHSKKGH